jgi:tetratricopeptide (TPR) repeat protein
MVAEPDAPQPSSVVAVILTVFAALLYLFMIWNAAAVPDLESIDQGVATVYALVAGVLLWAVLAGLLIVGASKGEMPVWAAATAFIAHPVSAAAAVASLFLMSRRYHAPHWPIVFPILLPLLLASYALWARFPKLHATLPATPISGAALGAILVLSLGQLGYTINLQSRQEREAREDRKAAEEQFVRQQAAKRQENLARFQRLTLDSPLPEWQEFLGKGNELEKQAVELARKLPNRQADAEKMLNDGNGFPLFHIGDLDLDATPEFCSATNAFVLKIAAENRPTSPDQRYVQMADHFDPWYPAMRWLIDQHCNMDATVAALEATIMAYPQAPERDKYLASLARLHPEWRACRGDNNTSLDQQIAGCDSVIASAAPGSDNMAVALFHRGDALLAKSDFDRAILDYGDAIHIRADFAEAFNNRGNAYDDKLQHDRAMQDYSEAIRLRPDFAEAFNNRGNAYAEEGEQARAIKDYDQAISINPKYQNALKNRGRSWFFKDEYDAATKDFAQALTLQPTDAYAVLWLFLARSRAGPVVQDDLRHDLRGDAASLDHSAWPWPLVAAYFGEQDTASVQTAARQADVRERADRLCDANFYLGEQAITAGDTTVALELLHQSENICPTISLESYSARFELDRTRK